MSVNEKMTNIANEIRSLSNTTEAMGLDSMASNLNIINNNINTQIDLISQITTALEDKMSNSASTFRLPRRQISIWEPRDDSNAYMIGEYVEHNNKIWISTLDDNIFEPGIYGWEEV